MPIPIEEIVEFGLQLEIRPIRALRARFGVDGYLSSDLETIVVDEELMIRYLNRYRFTLAHEVGHLLLHAEQIQAVACETAEEWKATVRSIRPSVYRQMEHQAYVFAGYALVPREPLLTLYQEASDRAAQQNVDLARLGTQSITWVAGWIAKGMAVSTEVVVRQLELEGLL